MQRRLRLPTRSIFMGAAEKCPLRRDLCWCLARSRRHPQSGTPRSANTSCINLPGGIVCFIDSVFPYIHCRIITIETGPANTHSLAVRSIRRLRRPSLAVQLDPNAGSCSQHKGPGDLANEASGRRERRPLLRECTKDHHDHDQLRRPGGRDGGQLSVRRSGCRLRQRDHRERGLLLSGHQTGVERRRPSRAIRSPIRRAPTASFRIRPSTAL